MYTFYVLEINMSPKKQLSDEERDFFSLVNQAVLANPFSDERIDIDRKIANLFPGVPKESVIETTVSEVRRRIAQLESKDRGSLDRFSGKDRDIMEISFLFDFFYQFIDQFDQLILNQVQAGEIPVKAPFYKDALSVLQKKGFDTEETLHLFALCFQLRRAFYFIDHGIIGRSLCMKKLRESLWNNVFTYDMNLYKQHLWAQMEDFSTLLLGETGTGKGAASGAIGRSGFIPFDPARQRFKESFTRSFTAINLSQFSENLIESELFGHRKGAFTGAVNDHEGFLNRCSPCGSIFLDEIGEVAIPIQIKLLKVLEERAFCPVGSHEEQRFDGRIIAATNRPLDELRSEGRMRDDFYYRLCSDVIVVPPLRQRIAEDPKEFDDLVEFSVERIIGMPSGEIAANVKKTITAQLGKHYSWPGNVRELGQCVRRILLKRNYEGTAPPELPGASSNLAKEIDRGDVDAQCLIRSYCRMLYDKFGTYGEVARRTKLDRRTVKKHIQDTVY